MSWWRYEKMKGRGSWLVGSEVTVLLMILLTVVGAVALTIAANIANFFLNR